MIFSISHVVATGYNKYYIPSLGAKYEDFQRNAAFSNFLKTLHIFINFKANLLKLPRFYGIGPILSRPQKNDPRHLLDPSTENSYVPYCSMTSITLDRDQIFLQKFPPM